MSGRTASDLPVFDYMYAYLKRAELNPQKNTAENYGAVIYSKIQQCFSVQKKLTTGNLTVKDIENFYDDVFSLDVKANTVIYCHAILRRAFHQDFKDETIDANPFDLPRKNLLHR